jgi:hypothetical protein
MMGREDGLTATIVITLLAGVVLSMFIWSASGSRTIAEPPPAGIDLGVEPVAVLETTDGGIVRNAEPVTWRVTVTNRTDLEMQGATVQIDGLGPVRCDDQTIPAGQEIECSTSTTSDGGGTVEARVSAWTDAGVVGHRTTFDIGAASAESE